MLVGNFGVFVCFGASFSGLVPVSSTPPESPPLASLPRMFIGFLVSLPCSLAVCFGDLGVCLGSLVQSRPHHPLVAAPGSVAADAEAFAFFCFSVDGPKIRTQVGRKLLSGRFNQGDFGKHFFLKG